MKLAYLIIVHKDPELLRKLIPKLSSENVHCFVHYNNNPSTRDFKKNSSG